MAFPASPTEAGGAKLHFGTTDGNAAAGWFAVDTGVTGSGTNTVGFLGIATHVHDDAAGSPGGLATSSVPVVVAGAVRDDALGGLTPAAGDAVYLLVDANGALWTHDDALDAAIDGAYINVNCNIAGTDFLGGAGGVAAGVQRVTLASDDPAVAALEIIDNVVLVEDVQHSTGDSGIMPLAVRNDALAALAGTDGDYAPLQVDEDGGLYTHPAAAPKGGCKMFTSVDLDESEEDPAAGPVTIYGIYTWNLTAGPLWLQMFNTNTVTVGTTAPTNNFMIPANADLDGAGVVIPIPVCGLAYDTALSVAITGASGTDNTDPGAAAAGIVILYQD